jgi:hypothetical protein
VLIRSIFGESEPVLPLPDGAMLILLFLLFVLFVCLVCLFGLFVLFVLLVLLVSFRRRYCCSLLGVLTWHDCDDIVCVCVCAACVCE